MFKLLDRIEKERPFIGRGKLPFTFGYAVAFPHSRYEGTLPIGISYWTIRSARISCPGGLPSSALGHLRDGRGADGFVSEVRNSSGSVEAGEERLRRLTDMQRQLLEWPSKLAAICGVAGSGKNPRHGQGSGVGPFGDAYFVFVFQQAFEGLDQAGHAGRCRRQFDGEQLSRAGLHLCMKAEIEFWNDEEGEAPASFWSEEVPDRLMNAMSLLGEEDKFDAIIVDEGQDFRERWIPSFGIRRTRAAILFFTIAAFPSVGIG